MALLIIIPIAILIWSIPVILTIRFHTLRTAYVDSFIRMHAGGSAIVYTDRVVWFKNCYPERYRQTATAIRFRFYDFNACDIILTDHGIIVSGKPEGSLLLKTKAAPILFTTDKKLADADNNILMVDGYRTRQGDFEIDFTDPKYRDPMTLVIKRVSAEHRDQLFHALDRSLSTLPEPKQAIENQPIS